jgi:hypothetical protein
VSDEQQKPKTIASGIVLQIARISDAIASFNHRSAKYFNLTDFEFELYGKQLEADMDHYKRLMKAYATSLANAAKTTGDFDMAAPAPVLESPEGKKKRKA